MYSAFWLHAQCVCGKRNVSVSAKEVSTGEHSGSGDGFEQFETQLLQQGKDAYRQVKFFVETYYSFITVGLIYYTHQEIKLDSYTARCKNVSIDETKYTPPLEAIHL